jgi:hypothetical protein
MIARSRPEQYEDGIQPGPGPNKLGKSAEAKQHPEHYRRCRQKSTTNGNPARFRHVRAEAGLCSMRHHPRMDFLLYPLVTMV